MATSLIKIGTKEYARWWAGVWIATTEGHYVGANISKWAADTADKGGPHLNVLALVSNYHWRLT